MNAIFNIARYELRRIFLSPLAWAVLAIVQFIMSFMFVNELARFTVSESDDYMGVTDQVLGSTFGMMTLVVLLVIPLMTMRLFSEERKNGSITLLFSAPVSLTEIVMGKFLGLAGFVAVLLGMLALAPLSLHWSTNLDWGHVAADLLGLFLMMIAFGAAGMFMSSLTREPTIAAVSGFGLLLIIWLLPMLADSDGVPMHDLINYLSFITHFGSMFRGVFNTADVLYYILFSTLFLWLTVQRLDMERN